MKRGDNVKIYEDPLTRTKLEGTAVLKHQVACDDFLLERWVVRFQGDEENVIRTIWIDDKKQVEEPREVSMLKKAVNKFAKKMKTKLIKKYKEGYRGWNNKKNITEIKSDLIIHVGYIRAENDFRRGLAVANLAMLLYRKRRQE